MSANYSDELFTTQSRLGGSWAAGQLGRCWPRYIKLRLILLSCYGYWTNGQSGHGSRPHTVLSSILFIWFLHPRNNIFASLKVASHPRLPIRFGTWDWVMKIFAKRLCAMCNVNNVLQPGHWHWAAQVFTSRNVVWRLLLSALSGPGTSSDGTKRWDGSVV